jgi:hypothetical protein
MPVGKKLRFDVFRRDLFTCQYCGRTPPAVVLEIDHFVPSSAGGSDEADNLLTACFDCNRGKSNTDLKQIPPSLQAVMEEKRERATQLEAYNHFLLGIRERENATISELGRYWYNTMRGRKDLYTFGPARVGSVRTFLKHLPVAEIKEAMDIARARMLAQRADDGKAWRYFCGVCWRKIKDEHPGATR